MRTKIDLKYFQFVFPIHRYTESVMNSYPSMGGASASSIAQFYHQAAAASAAQAGAVDSLGSACSQLSAGGLSSVASGQTLPDITRHPWLVTG